MKNSEIDKNKLKDKVLYHLEFDFVKSNDEISQTDLLKSFMLTLRDYLIRDWLNTQEKLRISNAKRVYYLSLEFLMGRLLSNTLISLGVYDEFKRIAEDFGYELDSVIGEEQDMGLGNGGLGRLAACFLESLSALCIPATGYSIRYEYGIFHQKIENGYQVEKPDDWLKYGNPWELIRPELTARVQFGGRVDSNISSADTPEKVWLDTKDVMAVPYDILIPGYKNSFVNNLRLWQARSTHEFNLYYFNIGEYGMAVEEKNEAESISKVLYPDDSVFAGKLLRLKQQYFFVSASLQDIIRHHKSFNQSLQNLPEKAAIQLNDTHPSIAIPELMRILIDIENFDWETAWNITRSVCSYTNHTIVPEALETWQSDIFQPLLPRHYELINEIDKYYKLKYVNGLINNINIQNISIVSDEVNSTIKMANLAAAGTHTINGVSELHTSILKNKVFRDFYLTEPDKFINITNGVSVRRFLLQANPYLSGLISSKIGYGWIIDNTELTSIEQFTDDAGFQNDWLNAKKANKYLLLQCIEEKYGVKLNPDSLFDSHIKRFHEYKRQLLKIFHVIYLYNKLLSGEEILPRTVIIGGKAAPSYFMAKLHIKLINCVADVINNDPAVNYQEYPKLKVIFVRNYGVSLAEKIIPATDLNEQISTAGFEASGTGNMKFALNGVLTIGTLDGANIEIRDAVGKDNFFNFGMSSDEVVNLRNAGYNPYDYYLNNSSLKQIIDMLSSDYFNKSEQGIFKPIIDDLLHNDYYMVMADFNSYIDMQDRIENEYRNTESWIKKCILNIARSGSFSSDRTIKEYSEKIWKV